MKKTIFFEFCVFVIGVVIALTILNAYAMYHHFQVIESSYVAGGEEYPDFLSMVISVIPVLGVAAVGVLVVALVVAKRISNKIMKPIIELDLDNPTNVYDELKPFLDRVETEKAIKAEAERMRREFSANVSHELKTPLTTISGYAQMINNGMAKAEDYHNFTSKIEKESQRLLLLIDDIIKLSNLDENSEIENEIIDMPELVRECIDGLVDIAAKKGVKIYFSATSASIYGSYTMISELVYNIIDNAIKYNNENGSVSVFTGEYADRVEFSVSDTGIGIESKECEHIFERFYRVDKSRSKNAGGTGLGLSIVKHIAKCHNAEISVKSKPGEGTTMTVSFPKKFSKK